MPEPVFPITSVGHDVPFTSQVDQQVQYQEAMYNFKETCRLAALQKGGAGVILSSDGTTFGAADHWTGPNDVTPGTWNFITRAALLGTGSWVVIDFGPYQILISVNDNGAIIPQHYGHELTYGVFSGGDATTLPGSSEGFSLATHSSNEIIDWTAVTPGSWEGNYNSRGDVFFGTKQIGFLFMTTAIVIQEPTDAVGGGKYLRRGWLWQHNGGLIGSTPMIAGGFRGVISDGSFGDSSILGDTLAHVVTTWPSGRDINNRSIATAILMATSSATAGFARERGQWIDRYGAPASVPFGDVDDTESLQTDRKICIGSIWIYLNTADANAGWA